MYCESFVRVEGKLIMCGSNAALYLVTGKEMQPRVIVICSECRERNVDLAVMNGVQIQYEQVVE